MHGAGGFVQRVGTVYEKEGIRADRSDPLHGGACAVPDVFYVCCDRDGFVVHRICEDEELTHGGNIQDAIL